jgi:hypothetical protein
MEAASSPHPAAVKLRIAVTLLAPLTLAGAALVAVREAR